MRAESTQACKTGLLHITEVNGKTTAPYSQICFIPYCVAAEFHCFYRHHKPQCFPTTEAASPADRSRYKLTQFTDKKNSIDLSAISNRAFVVLEINCIWSPGLRPPSGSYMITQRTGWRMCWESELISTENCPPI